MKEIKAHSREEKLDAVIRVRTAGARAVTAVRVVPLGSEVDAAFVDFSSARPITQYPPMVTLELVCPDADAATYVQVISSGALTGHRGDGAIFVSAVEEAVSHSNGDPGRGGAVNRVSRGPAAWRLVLTVFVVAVIVNYGWEVAQSVLYMPMASSMAQDLWRCFVASLGDGVLVLLILLVGWLVFRHLN